MTTTLVQPDAVVMEHRVAIGAAVLVRDGTVVSVGPATDADHQLRVAGTLLPGLIDLQTNGAGGHSVDEATPAALDQIAHAVWAGGATAFLPTLITAPWPKLLEQLRAVAQWIDGRAADAAGAEPLGIHLEGPFLEASGAHDDRLLLDPTAPRIEELLVASAGKLAVVTLAPGRPGAVDAVRRLREAGVTVAVGHGTATEHLGACVDAGARLATHLFNAMGPIHHRNPGMAGLVLDDERLLCSLIADGEHIHPAMLRNAYRCLGVDRVILVTDSVAAAGMPDGHYRLANIDVDARAGVVRDSAGRLAGTALTMAEAVRQFCIQVPTAGPWTAARVAATNQAQLLQRESLGRIAPGGRARFTAIDGDTITALDVTHCTN